MSKINAALKKASFGGSSTAEAAGYNTHTDDVAKWKQLMQDF